MFWYSKQEICTKWGNETSTCFTITNGVRQGGILSPTLFSIYMDDLCICICSSKPHLSLRSIIAAGIFTCDGCARDPYFYVPAETQSYVIKLSCSRKVIAASGV